jgi:hypothetical protein
MGNLCNAENKRLTNAELVDQRHKLYHSQNLTTLNAVGALGGGQKNGQGYFLISKI